MRRSWIILLVMLIGIVGLVLVYRAWSSGTFVVSTLDHVVNGLAVSSGLSPNLVRGLVILVTIPFFWAVSQYCRHHFWFTVPKPSLRLYRSPYGIVIISYVALYFLAMFFASRSAYASKWCAETPEGIKAFDGPGKDPIYGLKLEPCREDQIISLRSQEVPLREPQSITVDDPEHFEFWDKRSGRAKVWYFRNSDQSVELYDGPGKHGPKENLKPVDNDIRNELIRRHRVLMNQQASDVAKRVDASERERIDSFRRRYVNSAREGAPVQSSVIVFEAREQAVQLEDAIENVLKRQNISCSRTILKSRFVQDGLAEEMFRGDLTKTSLLELSKRVRFLVLGSLKVNDSPDQEFPDIRNAKMHLELKCIDVAANGTCGSADIHSQGGGADKERAVKSAIVRAEPMLRQFIESIPR